MIVSEAKARIAGLPPRTKARLAGLFEIFEGAAASWGQVFILNRLVVTGNAAATSANILAHPNLFRFGFALSVAGVIFHLAWGLLCYELFKPVSRTLSRFAAWAVLTTCVFQAVAALLYLGPWVALNSGGALAAFTPAQQQSLAYFFLRLNGQAFNLDLVFFGLWCFTTGILIWRSRFLPRFLGVLLAIDGLGWMLYLWPPLGTRLFLYIGIASGLAEIPLPWFFIFGFNEQRWNEQAGAAGSPEA